MKKLLLAPVTPRLFVIRVMLAVAILQALWIAVVPPFRASDEFDHAFRAAAVADGHWVATESTDVGRGMLVRAPADLVKAAENQCASLSYTGYDNCHSAGDAGDGHVWVGSGAATYNPVYYWVVGTAAQPFAGAASLYVMRVVSAVLCLIFVALGAWALSRRGTPRWAGVGFALALSPVLVFSMSMTAPNGLEMAAAIALWCALIAVPDARDAQLERRLLLVAGAAAVVLGFLRDLGPLFILLIVGTALVMHRQRAIDVIRRRRYVVLGCVLAVGLAVGWGQAWLRLIRVTGHAEQQGESTWSWTTLILWPLQTIAAFPYRDQPGPLIVYPVFLVAVAALLAMALRVAPRVEAAVVLGSAALALALPFGLTELTRSSRGVMWQGRYGLPLAVGFVLLAGVVADRWAHRPPRLSLLAPAGAVLAGCWAACLIKVLDDEGARWESTSDAAWHPPDIALIGAACVLAWWLLFTAISRREVSAGSPTGTPQSGKSGEGSEHDAERPRCQPVPRGSAVQRTSTTRTGPHESLSNP